MITWYMNYYSKYSGHGQHEVGSFSDAVKNVKQELKHIEAERDADVLDITMFVSISKYDMNKFREIEERIYYCTPEYVRILTNDIPRKDIDFNFYGACQKVAENKKMEVVKYETINR